MVSQFKTVGYSYFTRLEYLTTNFHNIPVIDFFNIRHQNIPTVFGSDVSQVATHVESKDYTAIKKSLKAML